MTFGNADDVSLAEARKVHAEARALLLRGLDPLDERGKTKLDLSHHFSDVAKVCIAAKAQGWRSPRWANEWRNTLRDYAMPVLGKMPVAEIGVEHVLKVLGPLWKEKPDVARRLRLRLETVLDYAKAAGWRAGENPATWRGNLKHLLAARTKVSLVHYAALDWRDAPELMAKLSPSAGVAERCLRFLLLTATRSGEARGCRWDEIDLDAAVWTIPAGRMKAEREHRVPLSKPALAILDELAAVRTGSLVFPSRYHMPPPASGKLASSTLPDVLRRIGHGEITVHGFRSTFRDWCGDTAKPADVAEAALAHQTGNAVVRAYARSDLFERRRVLMDQWADYLTKPPAQVVPLRRTGGS
jgi:integrase